MRPRFSMQDSILYHYRYFFGYALLISGTLVTLFLQLGSLVPGINELEAASALQSVDLSELLENPVYAPYRLLQAASVAVLGSTIWAARLPSVVFGLLTIALFFLTLRIWHRPRIAVLGGILLMSSSWFLHFARFGDPAIMLSFTVMLLLFSTAWLYHTKHLNVASALLGISLALALYVPYMWLLILVGVALNYETLKRLQTEITPKYRIIGAVTMLILVGPLIYGAVRDVGVLKELAGIGDSLPSIGGYFANVFDSFGYLFWRSFEAPALHLGDLPLLDIFTATMTALGLYHYEQHFDQPRARLLIVGFVVLLLAISISASPLGYAILIPFIYVFAATGVITLLTQWYQIFPKNPVARAVALVPMMLVVLVVMSYHLNRYFIAWPNAPETQAAFSENAFVLSEHVDGRSEPILVIATEQDEVALRYLLRDQNASVVIKRVSDVTVQDVLNADIAYVPPGVRLAPEITAFLNTNSTPIATQRTTESIAFNEYRLSASNIDTSPEGS